MADTKITALTALTAADPANDVIPIVDVSDTSMAASGTTKKISVNNILGASGTATLASATITGAATVGTTLGVTGNSTLTGSVGIGVAPSQKLTVLVADAAQAAQFRGASGYVRFRPYVDATNGGIIDATNTGESAYSNLTILANSLRLFGNSASGLTVGATGDVTVGAGNLVMGTANKGIDFSINSDASPTSELLNDYEEGTWTGTLKGAVDPTIAVTATGRYTKVGRVVAVQIAFEIVTTTGASGAITISGLPFTNNAGIRAIGTGGVFLGATFTGTMIAEISFSATSIAYYGINSNAVWSSADHNAGVGRYFWANVTYTV